jgi:hypothetical protein
MSNTWLAQLGEFYWLFSLFAWIIFYNLDWIEELVRHPTVQQEISECTKERRRMRRLHETVVLLLAFGALFFVARRQHQQQQDDTFSLPRPSLERQSCSIIRGTEFWRCVRSTNLEERGRFGQQNPSLVLGGNGLDANRWKSVKSDALSNSARPIPPDDVDVSASATPRRSFDARLFDMSDKADYADDVVKSIVARYLRNELEPHC